MSTDSKKIREAEEIGPFYAVVNYGNIGGTTWAHGPYDTKEEAKEKAKSIRSCFSATDRNYYHAWCRVYPQNFVDKGVARGMLKINNPKKYTESTPLEDRDDYAKWKKEYDAEQNKSAAEKYQYKLDDRNTPIYYAWYDFVEDMKEAGFDHYKGVDGFKNFLNEKEPYLNPTGYYDSDSFCTPGFYIHDMESGGIGIAVYYKGGHEAGGNVAHEFIPKLKQYGGAEINIIATVAIDDEDFQKELRDIESIRQFMNLYSKYLIHDQGMSRREAADVINFFNSIIDGSGKDKFTGATKVEFWGREWGRPGVMVEYDVSIKPTAEETRDVCKGLRILSDNVVKPFI